MRFLLFLVTTCGFFEKTHADTVLVMGDSLSAAHNMDISQGWVFLLEQEFDAKGCKIKFINASISGETSAGGFNRLPVLLNKHQPSVVIIELGGNDGLRGFPVSELHNNLSRMISLSREAGAKVLLLGIQIPSNYGRRYNEMFTAVFPSLESSLRVPAIPFFLEGVATNPDLMQADGIHPNVKAQPVLAERVAGPLMALNPCGE